MKRGWKITLVTLASLLGLAILSVAVVLWMVFTPSQLTKVVNKLAGQYVLCETHFERVDLTVFKTFPDAGLKVDNVYVVNPVEGAPSDTLASIGSLTVGVDLKRFLKENEVIVHQLLLDDVKADLYVGSDGRTNFDIFPSSQDEDTVKTLFSLDSLPGIDLKKIKISNLDASMLHEPSRTTAKVDNLDVNLVGSLAEGYVVADLKVESDGIAFTQRDSTGLARMDALLNMVKVNLKGDGDKDAVSGNLKMKVAEGKLVTSGKEMIVDALQQSRKELMSLNIPFQADLQNGVVKVESGKLGVDEYGIDMKGRVQLAHDGVPMNVDLSLYNTESDPWQVRKLLALLPFQVLPEGMDADAKVSFAATAVGALSDSIMPQVSANVSISNGMFSYPKVMPYKVNRIGGDFSANIDMNAGGHSDVTIHRLNAHTRSSDLSIVGRVGDLLGDPVADVSLKGSLPLADVMPMVPESVPLGGEADMALDLRVKASLSQLQAMALEKMSATGSLKMKNVDIVYDSINAKSPTLDMALQLPAAEHKGRVADVHITGSDLSIKMPGFSGTLGKPDINVGINNPLKEQLAASFKVTADETEVGIDSMMVSFQSLGVDGSMRMDSTQTNPLRRFGPVGNVNMHSAVFYTPELPDAMRLSQLSLKYNSKTLDINTAEVKVGHSDFQLYGTVNNLERWLDHAELLQADLNFTSGYADVDQILNMLSGMGSDADSLEQMRAEDNVPADANPFIVPKDVDLTLHTHIKRSVAFGNDLNDVAGTISVKDGVAVLDQIGFVCKAATMQLTALYKSPRPNNLFVALDFHLLDIEIDELLDMIPVVDTLVPMLSAFEGNANFHLAAETFLDARYQPKMSSLLGSAAISGRDLVVLDDDNIAQIAKLMQFKSRKEKDSKIRVDSLDVEMTCFRKEIEVFPFLLNIGKYQICASGKHTLDNQCSYHLELLKNPLLAKVGVDVRGSLAKPKISLGSVRYADLYRPEKQGVVEKRTLEMKRMIKEALENNVR